MPQKYKPHPLYGAWAGMIGRCHNSNHSSFSQYGARGIVVCERWRTFSNFLQDMGERPTGHTLDRIDSTGPYAPDNCRWATPKEQRANYSADGVERQRRGASEGARRRWDEYRAMRGPKPPKRKYTRLTKKQVIEIRQIGRSMTIVTLGKMFGVSHRTISAVLLGQSHHHPDWQKEAAAI